MSTSKITPELKSMRAIPSKFLPYLMDVILPAIPSEVSELNTAAMMLLRNRLYALRHCYQRKGFFSHIVPLVDRMLGINLALWELVHDNEEALADVKNVTRVRRLSLGANLIGQIEEVLSGEESLGDVLVNSISTFLDWKADTLWVKMAKGDRSFAVESHRIRLQDALWQFIGEFVMNNETTLSNATALGDKIEEILSLVTAPEVSVHLQIVFTAQVYVLLLHLYVRQLFLSLSTREE